MYFTYKGKSSRDFCLKIKEINNLSSPSRALDIHQVLGRNGDLIVDNGNYNNFTLEITCFIDGRPDKNGKEKSLEELASELKAWLQTDFSYSPLAIDDGEFFYEAYLSNSLDISELFTNFAEVLLTFNCKPLKKKEAEIITITDQLQTIRNEYMDSEPYMKIYGSGDIIISINNRPLKFKNVENYIEVDTELMNCFKGETNQNNRMYSDFPILTTGENVFSWVGNVTKIEIEPRWVKL